MAFSKAFARSFLMIMKKFFFEADDVDASAMHLKNIFSGGVDEITETWIYNINLSR